MPRIYRTKKNYEAVFIRGFVVHLGYRLLRVAWQERPDALCTIKCGGKRKRVAVELTAHYIDTVAGKSSPLNRVGALWHDVESSLVRRISHRQHLLSVIGRIRFDGRAVDEMARNEVRANALELARELVELVENNLPATEDWVCLSPRDLKSHSLLAESVDSIRFTQLKHNDLFTVRGCWACCNLTTGNIAVSLSYIESAIEQKNKKATSFENWGDAAEKWLLIAAGSGDVNTHAPRFAPNINWNDPELTKLCRSSYFDKIAFWEPVGQWHKWLKP